MKKCLLILLFFVFSGKLFAQNFKIPTLNWQYTSETKNHYVDLLKLKDSNALIIKISYSSYWSKGQNAEFIVYQNDGNVRQFLVYQPNSSKLKIKVKRKHIRKKRYHHYWNYLQMCVNYHKFDIDISQLNITQKKGKKAGTTESMSVSDGTNYYFQICQGKNYISYGSYAPLSYIKNEYPGAEERQKLVDIMNGFKALATFK